MTFRHGRLCATDYAPELLGAETFSNVFFNKIFCVSIISFFQKKTSFLIFFQKQIFL